jgi:hypothetical protein
MLKASVSLAIKLDLDDLKQHTFGRIASIFTPSTPLRTNERFEDNFTSPRRRDV